MRLMRAINQNFLIILTRVVRYRALLLLKQTNKSECENIESNVEKCLVKFSLGKLS